MGMPAFGIPISALRDGSTDVFEICTGLNSSAKGSSSCSRTCSCGAPREFCQGFLWELHCSEFCVPKGRWAAPAQDTEREVLLSEATQQEHCISQEGSSKPSCKINKNKSGSQGKAATKPLLWNLLELGLQALNSQLFPHPWPLPSTFPGNWQQGHSPAQQPLGSSSSVAKGFGSFSQKENFALYVLLGTSHHLLFWRACKKEIPVLSTQILKHFQPKREATTSVTHQISYYETIYLHVKSTTQARRWILF